MKYNYITPQSEQLEMLLYSRILEDSSLVDYYGGDDTTVVEGQW